MKTNPNDACVGNLETDAGALTKREYFAALMLQGIIANPEPCDDPSTLAFGAVKYADELIAALNKESL